MSEKFCLKWNEFESNISKSFGLLRNEEYLHDVTLVCDDNSQVSAHKFVLSACSEYFKTIFKNNSHPSPLICLEGISSPVLRDIIDYMYYGEANIFQEKLDNFLSVAQRLQILGLIRNDNVKQEDEVNDEELYLDDKIQDPSHMIDNDNIITNSRSSSKRNPGSNQRMSTVKVNLINGDQQEIDRKVDEHIETYEDGSLKCSLCGKVDNCKRTSGKQNIRNHVETHLEGISYQCQFCEMTFRSRNPYRIHRSRIHK